jgi:phosphoglycolate phosphatase
MKFLGPPLRDSFRTYCGLSVDDTEEAVIKYREYFAERGIYENTLYPDIINMLDCLENKGIKMAVATSKATRYAQVIIEYFGLSKYFGCIIGSEMDGTRSRKDEVINHVLGIMDNGFGLRSVMVGDRKQDMDGARLTGISGIGVMWGYGSREEFFEANYIADTPLELCRYMTIK